MPLSDRQYLRILAIETAVRQNDWHSVNKWVTAFLQSAIDTATRTDKFRKEMLDQLNNKRDLTITERLQHLRDQAQCLGVELTDQRVLQALEAACKKP